MDVAGAVLAGGQSRRMGRTKALIDVDGQPMATHVAHALATAGCRDVVLVGGNPAELASLELPVIADRYPGEGPVGGVLTALHHHLLHRSSATHVVVAACDLPGLSANAVERMLDAATMAADVVVAMTDRVEPVLAVWNLQTIAPLEAAFETGIRALHEVFALFRVATVAIDPGEMRNINHPEDLLKGTLRDAEGAQ
jgi:molybdopterin-guanine dinucleotide biosynthesis protein A|tara:strand:+ start:3265 stop:3855 length:591 start_codon:yes stop_codon:yes gene_type:complete